MMTKDMTVQHVGSTLPFPGRHLMGVFDSWQEAEQAVRVLLDAGYQAEDIALIASQDFPSAFQEHVRKEGRFRHMTHQLQVTTDEESLGELFLAVAREGSHIISISVPQREHIDEVSAILFNHGARLVKYVSHWSIEDLFPPSKEETEATRGLGYEPESDDQQPGQTLQQFNSTRSQDWGREQASQISGQLSGPITGKDFDQAADITDYSEGTMQEDQEKQDGQEMNVEQAHQTNTAQYTGIPDIKTPSIGQDPGSAYGYMGL